jgi:hypothetical protein
MERRHSWEAGQAVCQELRHLIRYPNIPLFTISRPLPYPDLTESSLRSQIISYLSFLYHLINVHIPIWHTSNTRHKVNEKYIRGSLGISWKTLILFNINIYSCLIMVAMISFSEYLLLSKYYKFPCVVRLCVCVFPPSLIVLFYNWPLGCWVRT